MKNIKPDYNNKCILNLTSSVEKILGKKPRYKILKNLDTEDFKDKTNLILIIVDGLGYDYFKKYSNSELNKYLKSSLTSVFPSVTSAAITSLSTGLSPIEHEMTGWHMYLNEVGCVTIPLPHIIRSTRDTIQKTLKITDAFNLIPLSKNTNLNPYVIYPKSIVNSEFTKAVAGKSKRIGYKTMNQFFSELMNLIEDRRKKKFVFAYYPYHDSLSHKHGSESKKTLSHFGKLQEKLIKLIKKMKNTNTSIILTSDHGMIDVPRSKIVNLKNHPKLKNTLRLPLCGDFRYCYCYVKPNKTKEFESYVREKMGDCCNLYKSKDLIDRNFFGLSKPSKRFKERVGDYVLIMKKNYAIYDLLKNEKPNYNVGDHGGLSREEMLVPLVVINSQ